MQVTAKQIRNITIYRAADQRKMTQCNIRQLTDGEYVFYGRSSRLDLDGTEQEPYYQTRQHCRTRRDALSWVRTMLSLPIAL